MKRIFLLAMALLTAGVLVGHPLYAADASAPGDQTDDEVDVDKECARLANLQAPASDMRTTNVQNDLAGCNAEELYYDTQSDSKATQTDWNRVRACSFAKNDSSVLMMLYANGFGVKRNYDLAIRYACRQRTPESDFAVDVMITDLFTRKTSGTEPTEQFEQCKFCANNISCGQCVYIEESQKDKARMRRLSEIGHRMDVGQKAAFDKLVQTAQDFALSSSRNETDQSGSSRASYVIGAEADVQKLFLKDVEQCEQGTLPDYTLVQFAALDKQLNSSYQAIMHTRIEGENKPLLPTGITKSGIKETQKIWLKFRDAWVDYGRLRYSQVPAYAWKAMLTERRIKQLEDLRNSDPPVINEE